ncbi:substrate-binding periplasmic protein [Burkholderiaceae bacterium UC74_6]
MGFLAARRSGRFSSAFLQGFACCLALALALALCAEAAPRGPAGPPAQEPILVACADPPAWTTTARNASGAVTETGTSFSFDMLSAALKSMGRTVRFVALPWARCMKEVEAGHLDYALGAYYSDERARRFSYSVPYSRGTPQVFFLRSRQLAISRKEDLLKFHGCGLAGGSYAHYGLKPAELDLGVNTYERLVKKLKAGRCDYFVEELEVIAGYKHIGNDYLADPELAHGPVPGVTAPAAHLIAGLNGRASALMPQLNVALLELVRSGQAAQLWRRHAGDIPYQTP